MLALNELRVDRRLHPMDIDSAPEFSWDFQEGSDEEERSYRLEVASDESLLVKDQPDMWDSGERLSSAMFGLRYAGKKLSSRTAYYVKLIVEGDNGSVSTLLSAFETTLRPEEWKGSWIGVPNEWNGGALSVRKTLDSFGGKKIVRARAYICGLGYHELYVNGAKIGDAVLNPGVTDYDKRAFYCTYDLTANLKGECDVIGVVLGYGWYGNRKLLAQFYVLFEDGSEYEAHSSCNGGWWFAPNPIIANSIYGGETYDARIEDEYLGGFSSPNLKADYNRYWFGSIRTQPAHGRLVPQTIEPIKVFEEYPGTKIASFGLADSVYDIHQNIAGWCKIAVSGDRGATVTLRHAETLTLDGHIDQTNLRTAQATDVYILKGSGIESYAPRFTYHGFRYVEVTIEGNAELISLVGQHVHSDNSVVSSFETNDEAINQLHKMALITEQNNQYSILTDCPQRDERFGWLNDVSTRVFQSVYNFDMDLFFRKVDADMTLCADEKGAISDTAPYYTGGRPADVTSLSYLLLAREAYRYYGDKTAAKENYAGHKAWVDFLLSHSVGYIMDYYYYADWVSCDNYPDAHSDGIYVSSIFLYWHLTVLSELAAIVGKKTDARRYAKLACESKTAFNEKYFHDDHYHEGTQCEDAMALSLGLCPKSKIKAVYNHMVTSIVNHDFHITCGNQGYRHVMYQLCENGDADLLIKVLENPNYPGWGFMLANGATTVWERWEKENLAMMNSFDHPMFGSYDAAFFRYLAGIRIDDGGRKITIQPSVPRSLSYVRSSFRSIRGLIVLNWRKDNMKIIYEIVIPPNTQAELILEKEASLLDGEKVNGKRFVLGPGHHEASVEA